MTTQSMVGWEGGLVGWAVFGHWGLGVALGAAGRDVHYECCPEFARGVADGATDSIPRVLRLPQKFEKLDRLVLPPCILGLELPRRIHCKV
jgi:hypothetical protein